MKIYRIFICILILIITIWILTFAAYLIIFSIKLFKLQTYPFHSFIFYIAPYFMWSISCINMRNTFLVLLIHTSHSIMVKYLVWIDSRKWRQNEYIGHFKTSSRCGMSVFVWVCFFSYENTFWCKLAFVRTTTHRDDKHQGQFFFVNKCAIWKLKSDTDSKLSSNGIIMVSKTDINYEIKGGFSIIMIINIHSNTFNVSFKSTPVILDISPIPYN